MKRKSFKLMAVFMALIVSANFISCSDDDDSSEGTSSNVENILMQNGWQRVANYDFGMWGDYNLSLSKDQVWVYFLGNNVALGKWYYHEDDSYFGSSTSIKPLEMKYSVDGSKVTIDGTTFKYKNEALYSLDGDLVFTKTTKDLDWIEKYKYYIMPDEQRLNFDYWSGFDKFGVVVEGSKRICVGFLGFGVNGNQKPYSRQVTSMRAEYSISGGKFWGKNKLVTDLTDRLYISNDEDCKNILDVTFETTQSVVTINASFYLYDSKNKRDVYCGKNSITIDVSEWVKETYGGDNNNDGDGSNDNDQNQPVKTCPDSNHPHMIDLGLPSGTLWACCNVGAKKPEEYGDYYAWGETRTKEYYYGLTYSYYDDSDKSYVNLGSDIAGSQYDAATAKWGDPWRMPSKKQIEELLSNTTQIWTYENDVKGSRFTSKKNGNSIFLPAAGYHNGGIYGTYIPDEGDYFGAGAWLEYWSSTQTSGYPNNAGALVSYDDEEKWYYEKASGRHCGRSVRPVRKK